MLRNITQLGTGLESDALFTGMTFPNLFWRLHGACLFLLVSALAQVAEYFDVGYATVSRAVKRIAKRVKCKTCPSFAECVRCYIS